MICYNYGAKKFLAPFFFINTNAWEQRELGKVFTIRNEKNGDRYTREDVLAVSDTYGCVT